MYVGKDRRAAERERGGEERSERRERPNVENAVVVSSEPTSETELDDKPPFDER